jgi:hypothetical protein
VSRSTLSLLHYPWHSGIILQFVGASQALPTIVCFYLSLIQARASGPTVGFDNERTLLSHHLKFPASCFLLLLRVSIHKLSLRLWSLGELGSGNATVTATGAIGQLSTPISCSASVDSIQHLQTSIDHPPIDEIIDNILL